MQQSGSVPVGAMALISHVYENGIVVISAPDGVFVLADAFFQASTSFSDVLSGARGPMF